MTPAVVGMIQDLLLIPLDQVSPIPPPLECVECVDCVVLQEPASTVAARLYLDARAQQGRMETVVVTVCLKPPGHE